MTAPSEPLRGGLGLPLILGAGIGFALLAPIGLFTLPLATLVLLSHPGERGYRVPGVLAGGISLWWLLQPGDPSGQVVKAAAVMGTVVFAVFMTRTTLSLIHRALTAVAAASVGVVIFAVLRQLSWPEVRWWVESKINFTAHVMLARLTTLDPSEGAPAGGDPMVFQLENLFEVAAPLMADFFPATVVVQMLAGFALATVLHNGMNRAAGGRTSPFRDFRFSEHLGWAAVGALSVVLLARVGTMKLLAANVLVVTGVLYALRGMAVAWFVLVMAGGPGWLGAAVIGLSIVFLLPVVLAGSILLGVVDTGLDLRARWSAPRVGS